ncbi:hypothetical protein DL96DRAFT_601728 [Flagelloscypha sp. PMI_526]|nr:hypothetical protein DL96DRAFT_601728 [Flagelloscypha sp. PMI_526]
MPRHCALSYMTETSLENAVMLVTPFKSSIHSFSCLCLDFILPRTDNDEEYNQWFEEVLNFSQYTSLTKFTGNLTLAVVSYEEDRQPYIQRFAQILRSGQPTATSGGLRFVIIRVGFTPNDSHDPPFWSPIVEAPAVITTLERVSFEIWHHGDVKISMYLPWKRVIEEALNTVGLLGKSEFIDCNGGGLEEGKG